MNAVVARGQPFNSKKKNVDAFIVKKVRPSTHANINTIHAKRRRLTMCLLFVCSIKLVVLLYKTIA